MKFSEMSQSELEYNFNLNAYGFNMRKKMSQEVLPKITGLNPERNQPDTNPEFDPLYGETLLKEIDKPVYCEHNFKF